MKDVRESEHEHQIVLDVPHVVARQFLELCRDECKNANTQASQARYCGLVSMIERELDKSNER